MNICCRQGFTLVELLVAIVLATIVSAVIYSAYEVQTNIYQEQSDVVQVQQNIRSSLAFLQREARMAGYRKGADVSDTSCSADPAAGPAQAPGIHTATATTLGFSMDLNGDGDCADAGENVLYQLFSNSDNIQCLGRNDLTDAQAQQAIADNIDNLEFVYLFEPPRIGSPVDKPPTSTPSAEQLEDIRTVQVSLLARAALPAKKRAQVRSFTLPKPDAWGQPGSGGTEMNVDDDKVRRRVLTTLINFRNLGL